MIGEGLWLLQYGAKIFVRKMLSVARRLAAWGRFWGSYARYRQLALPDQRLAIGALYPCLGDDTPQTPIEPVYFYQDAWAFEHIVANRPSWHVDIGSHHKFVSLLSKVVRLTMVDVRPLALPMDTIEFRQGSILQLPFSDGSVASLSSLCVIEHVGLGRYGDPLDPLGSEKALGQLKRVVAPGGRLYLSVPLGDRTVVAFNGGRILARDYFLELIRPFRILEQRYIVGDRVQDHYESRPMFETTGLFALTKPQLDGAGQCR